MGKSLLQFTNYYLTFKASKTKAIWCPDVSELKQRNDLVEWEKHHVVCLERLCVYACKWNWCENWPKLCSVHDYHFGSRIYEYVGRVCVCEKFNAKIHNANTRGSHKRKRLKMLEAEATDCVVLTVVINAIELIAQLNCSVDVYLCSPFVSLSLHIHSNPHTCLLSCRVFFFDCRFAFQLDFIIAALFTRWASEWRNEANFRTSDRDSRNGKRVLCVCDGRRANI